MSAAEEISIALESVKVGDNLYDLALSFRIQGMTQKKMLSLFDLYRSLHANDADQTKYNAVLDTMDFVSGHCNSEMVLFRSSEE